MSQHNKTELIISLLFIIILVLFLNPLGFWMPRTLSAIMLAGLAILFVLFVFGVLREGTGDERDKVHRARASRFAVLITAAGLLIGIAAQALSGHVDPWLVVGLIILVAGRALAFSREQRLH